MKVKIVYVKWADAHGSGGEWEPIENAGACRLYAHVVGFLWDENAEDVSLVQNLAINKDDEDAFYNRLNIPRGMIVEMQTLGEIDTEDQGVSNAEV